MKTFAATPIAILLIVLAGCDSQEDDPLKDVHQGLSVAETSNPEIPVIAVHEDGDVMAVLTNPSGTQVRAAVFVSEAGSELYVEFDGGGLPEKAYANGYTILFENYQNSTVDLAFISSNGAVEILREVELDTQALSKVALALDKPNTLGAVAISLSQVLEIAGAGMAVASCAIAVGTASAVTLGAASIPVAAIACPAAFIKTAALLLPEDETGLRASVSAFGALASGVLCFSGEVSECVSGALDVVTGVVILAEDAFGRIEDEILVAQGALETGSGDVQVTLSWDTTDDIDLWVTDPLGERIYFANSSSQSGGQLDRDDTNGFGPENIFWPRGQAPRGRYKVQVDHFSGSHTTNYTVLIQAFGRARSFTGSVLPNQTVDVTTFSDTELARIAKNEICHDCISMRESIFK